MAENGCLGCELIAVKPVTLRDGRTVCSNCEDWRAETEARYVLTKPTAETRKAYLDGVEKKRGQIAADRLREEVKAEWQRRKDMAKVAA